MKKDNDKVEKVELVKRKRKRPTNQVHQATGLWRRKVIRRRKHQSINPGENIDLADKLRGDGAGIMQKGETEEQVFIRNGKNINDLPKHQEIIDIVHAGGLQKWAETLRVSSQKELYGRLMTAIRRTIAEPVFQQ